jgi:hypothetical protein
MSGKPRAAALAVLATAGALIAAAPAAATVTSTTDAAALLQAMSGSAMLAGVTPNFLFLAPNALSGPNQQPPTAFPVGIGTTPLPPFGQNGASYGVLTSGNATVADDPSSDPSADNGVTPTTLGRGDSAYDATIFRVPSFTVPAGSGLTCLSFDFRFLSAEYPDFIDSDFNDAFIAELAPDNGDSLWTTKGAEITGRDHNFAFDANGLPVTIKSTGPRSMSPAEAAGTPYGGATAPLRAQTPVTPGNTYTLYLSIFDQSDAILDTAVFIDNLALSSRTGAQCSSGAVALGPAVAIGAPSAGGTVTTATPTLSGTADGTGDVTLRIYAGAVAAGTPVQQLTAARAGTSWSATPAALPDGQYTAQATDAGVGGLNGVSSPVTFTVATSPVTNPGGGTTAGAGTSTQAVGDRDGDGIPDNLDDNDGSRPPIPGKSVDVRVVSGEVFIKYPAGGSGRSAGPSKGFVPLKGAANIPMGSQLDTTTGRVALTSAADTGGAKTQTADFYQGIFAVKQAVPKTTPKKPAPLITDLALKGASASTCAPLKGARSAEVDAKKKGPKGVLGKLWGNGKGKFRTSGKYSSATVRGTIWLTQDECDGTLTKVTRGVVQVRDFNRKKTVTVNAGHSYLARAQRATTKAKRRVR